jgi:hypothetical protein
MPPGAKLKNVGMKSKPRNCKKYAVTIATITSIELTITP